MRGAWLCRLVVVLALTFVGLGCGGESTPEEDASRQDEGGGGGGERSEQTVEKTREEKREITFEGVAEATTSEMEATGETTDGMESTGSGMEEQVEDEDPRTRPSDTLVAGATDATGGPLAKRRMVSFYGHPLSNQMGILGEFGDLEAMGVELQKQADAYTQIDPDRPAIPTIELIASVAQPVPGPDGLYLTRTSPDLIEEYATFAEENDFELLLDVQIGYSTIAEEIEVLRPFLERPYVHLAIDPEYDMDPGEVPGRQFGTSTGEEIMEASRTLSQIVEEEGLPPKVLVIHQFRYDMILNKEVIEPVKNVETVVHADGFGAPADKIEKYDLLVRQEPIQYGGFKLFYTQDVPLLTPQQVLDELEPNPAVISYQ
jgi:hypothetical protein